LEDDLVNVSCVQPSLGEPRARSREAIGYLVPGGRAEGGRRGRVVCPKCTPLRTAGPEAVTLNPATNRSSGTPGVETGSLAEKRATDH
jgi:hypothetical protein